MYYTLMPSKLVVSLIGKPSCPDLETVYCHFNFFFFPFLVPQFKTITISDKEAIELPKIGIVMRQESELTASQRSKK